MTLGQDKFEGYAILKFGGSRICKNAGQLGLGSSRPELSRPRSSRPGPILSLGMCLKKKEFIQQKLEEGCLILRNIL